MVVREDVPVGEKQLAALSLYKLFGFFKDLLGKKLHKIKRYY